MELSHTGTNTANLSVGLTPSKSNNVEKVDVCKNVIVPTKILLYSCKIKF